MSDIIAQYNGDYEAVVRSITEAQEKVRALIKDIVPAVTRDFFARHPEVYGIGWVQYAPYWNDGEACTFSLHEINLWLTEESLDDNGFHEGDQYSLDDASEVSNDFAKIVEIIEGIEDHYFEEIYGDGVSVLFTKDGVKVRKHKHG